MPPVDGGEGGVLGKPLEFHRLGLTVAVLGDDALGQIVVFAVLIVVVVPVEEHDDVGVLLDGARLAQVGEHGALVGAALRSAGELGEADHRHIEFLGHDFQGPGDVGDDLLAVVARAGGAAGGGHELEIVYDHQAQIIHPAALGVHVGHAKGGVVVNEDLGLVQGGGGRGDAAPVLLAQTAGDQLFVVHEGLA